MVVGNNRSSYNNFDNNLVHDIFNYSSSNYIYKYKLQY